MNSRAGRQHFALPTSAVELNANASLDRWKRLRELIEKPLSFPGQGRTLDRWRALACVAAEDLSMAKIYESHADALAILGELGDGPRPGLWAIFAAEPPGTMLRALRGASGLSGEKAWCSGAARIDAALVTCIDEAGERRLAKVDFQQAGILRQPSSWAAAGMAETETLTIVFENVAYEFVGGPRSYLDRPGFWQGAIGVAACWFGAAAAIGRTFRRRCEQRADAHALVHLGVIDATLQAAGCALKAAAAWVDDHPKESAQHVALATRATVERAVDDVITRCGRALGAGPLCCDPAHARRVQDLTVFIRQSHAERDLEALGQCCTADTDAWFL